MFQPLVHTKCSWRFDGTVLGTPIKNINCIMCCEARVPEARLRMVKAGWHLCGLLLAKVAITTTQNPGFCTSKTRQFVQET